jgi:hypothetical protein
MRATLRRHADDAPRTDLTTGALTRARRIRTRRRLTVAAAALGVAAVIVPLGTGIVRSGDDSNLADRGADETSSATSTTGLDAAAPLTEVTLSDLPSGAAPDVPYLDQGRLVRSSGTEVVPGSSGDTSRPGSAYLVDAVALDDGVVGFRADPKSQSLGLYTAGSSMLPSSPQTVQPAIDSDGSMAYAAKGVDVDGRPAQVSTIVYTSRVDGSFRFAYSDDATVTQVMDVEDGIVLYDALDAQGRRFVGRAGNFSNDARVVLDRPYPDVVALSAADQGVGLMVGRTTGMNKHCNAMLSTSDAATLWRSCSWRPTEFSPDGSRVYAVRLPIDGAITESAVLDANDGTVIRRFSTDGSFGRATFESDNALDVVTVEGGEAAIVRCSASGDCELATDLATARPDTEAAPYQLTANP